MRRSSFFSYLAILWWLLLFAAAAQAQSIVLSVQAVDSSLGSGVHRFGVHDDALLGVDPYDLPEPPAPPGEHLSLAFRMPVPDAPLPDRWRDELRPSEVLEDQTETWTLEFDALTSGGLAWLVFETLEGVDLPLSLTVTVEGHPAQWVDLPGDLPVPANGVRTITVELVAEHPVAREAETWGAVKTIFAR